MSKLRTGIIGVSGYAGGELARLLLGHPEVELTYVTSGTYKDQPLSRAFPGMARRTDLVCREFDSQAAIELCDTLYLAGENGFAVEVAGPLLEAGKKVIDLSADFRLQDLAIHKQYYKFNHSAPNLVADAAYGLPELFKSKIAGASLVANPGCHATAVILSLAPLVDAGWIDIGTIVANSLSGVSGAGRSKHNLTYHFPELNESVRAYGVAGEHRHTPEIEQTLSGLAGEPVALSFTPHLIPVTRGILTTTVATLTMGSNCQDIIDMFHGFYVDAPFVVVLPDGEQPATKHTNATNYIHIGVAVDERLRRVTITAGLDNLIKGAAGQAVQNMNLMFDFDETTGLEAPAIWP